MNYNDPKVQARLEAICDAHFPRDCVNCPLRAACESGRNPSETDSEYTARWEAKMVSALDSIKEG